MSAEHHTLTPCGPGPKARRDSRGAWDADVNLSADSRQRVVKFSAQTRVVTRLPLGRPGRKVSAYGASALCSSPSAFPTPETLRLTLSFWTSRTTSRSGSIAEWTHFLFAVGQPRLGVGDERTVYLGDTQNATDDAENRPQE